MTPPTVPLTLVDGVQVLAADTLEQITPYVLREQGDWFEDELRFLRRVPQPGQQVVDIGANHGVYALSLAKAVGPRGHVSAFEPASTTAELLERSVALNGLAQIQVLRQAVSNQPGRARLSLETNSELNALVPRGQTAANSEEVEVTTLDAAAAALGWRDVAVLKLDAEGEEARILEGGARFLTEQAPLVMFEVKAGATVNLGLAEAFAARGFGLYRLAPGPGLLVPFEPGKPADAFLLNLFAARPERAAALEARGLLARKVEAATPPPDAARWPSRLAGLPYAAPFLPSWRAANVDPALEQALAWHAVSQDPGLAAPHRWGALTASLTTLNALCAQALSQARLASLARVARDFGARALAVSAAQELAQTLLRDGEARIDAPFLPLEASQEQATPGEDAGNWMLCLALEAVERWSAFSSFYTGPAALQRLTLIADLGFGSPEMARRLALVRQRHGPAGAR